MNQVKLYNKDGSVEYDGPDAKTLDITSLYGSVELKHKTAETVLVNMADGTLTCDGGSFADLSVVNQYGEINLNQITASAMSIDASDAGITMNGINVDHITIVNDYGSISSDTMETDSIMVKQSDGQCTMKRITVRDGVFENKYGDMKLYLTGDETDYNYELSMKYGTIRLNERNFEEQSVHENHGADRNIKMTASDGAMTIRTGGLE